MGYSIKNLKKVFGQTVVLDCLSLSIENNEKVAIIGPSGSGKSTLLNILSKYDLEYSGEIMLDENDLKNYNNKKNFAKKVGIIRQTFDLIEPLPVIHNVLIGRFNTWSTMKALQSFIFPTEEEYVSKVLSTVGLSNKLYSRTSKLSGGEKQRVAIARIIAQNPDIVIADEPVASLDPVHSENVLKLLVKATNQSDQSLIVSMHQVDLALKYFDRIIGIKGGKIFLDHLVDQITKDHLTQLYAVEEVCE